METIFQYPPSFPQAHTLTLALKNKNILKLIFLPSQLVRLGPRNLVLFQTVFSGTPHHHHHQVKSKMTKITAIDHNFVHPIH